jgi:tartrate/fumarate subfamily iron-sulfur-dependent hydro-lyase alpha chain
MKNLRRSLLELIRKTSTELPTDVQKAVAKGTLQEENKSRAKYALEIIQENIQIAFDTSLPLCQDTGTITFYVHGPVEFDQLLFLKEAKKAVAEATKVGYLRQNSVDSITGNNSGDNLGPGTPVFHFNQWKKKAVEVKLILKGGGCENVSAQYSLPDNRLNAGRDLNGVQKAALDAVFQAQGKGCGPGILGICIGGDRATGYEHAKLQFLRTMDDRSNDPELEKLEKNVMEMGNQLGIGPMGFGGKTTLLGVKASKLNRLPASFFVTISYMCWAFRRQGITLDPKGYIRKWIY